MATTAGLDTGSALASGTCSMVLLPTSRRSVPGVTLGPIFEGMPPDISPRLAAIVDALPLTPRSRVLEIGCGSGATARAIARQLDRGHIVAIDRSAKAVAQARARSATEIASGRMSVRHVAAESFVMEPDDIPFDIVFAVRVGALDGRHPDAGQQAIARIRAALAPGGRVFIDGGQPLRELDVTA
jgi:SAM-dependent methyltransferase